MVSHKLKNIIGIVMVVMIVAVNALTVMFIVQSKSTQNEQSIDNTATGGLEVSATAPQDTTLFGVPREIILQGNGKTISVTEDDELFYELLELNERRSIYVPQFTTADSFDTAKINAYYMEYVYAEPHEFKPQGIEPVSVSKITFVLTGQYHGSMKYDVDNVPTTIGKLSVEPELVVTVVEMLS